MGTNAASRSPVIVRPTGEIDLANIEEFENTLKEAAQKAPQGFIIDLTDTVYIDSAGVQAIVSIYSKLYKADGQLALVMGNPMIRSVLEVVHLEKLPRFYVRDSLQAAIDQLTCDR